MAPEARAIPRQIEEIPRKPMVQAVRPSLFRRRIDTLLSSAAIDLLLVGASVLSEGGDEGDGFFGSTMITVDLARLRPLVSDALTETACERLAGLVGSDKRVLARARDIGTAESKKLCSGRLAKPQVDVRVRRTGAHLHIDVDVEAAIKS